MVLGRVLVAATALTFVCLSGAAQAGPTIDAIKERGAVRCGVNTGLAGFSIADSQGRWTGLDADFCRTFAAAPLGDAEKVHWVPLSAQQRFTARQSGEVDVLSRNTTWPPPRAATLAIGHAPGGE